MTNKKLKELLNQYPDDSRIIIYDNEYKYSQRDIYSVLIEYIDDNDYSVPEIILK